MGAVPARLIEDDDRVAVGGDVLADLGQMQAHGLGVDGGQDEGGGRTAARADRAEQVGRLITLVPGLASAGATRCPLPGGLALLADAAPRPYMRVRS